jgi:hypothetical protein
MIDEHLVAITKARDALAVLARLLADGDFPPSAVEVKQLIERLASVGDTQSVSGVW